MAISTVRFALERVHIPGTPAFGAKVFVPLLIATPQRWESLPLLLDSGSSVTTIPVTVAHDLRLVVPEHSLYLQVQTALGRVRQRRHPGHITVRIPGVGGRQFVWPCHFVEYRGVPPVPVLGLAGVLDDFRIIFDGSYTLDAPYGSLLLEQRRL